MKAGFGLLACLAIAALPAAGRAATSYDVVACPNGLSGQMTKAEFERLTAPYRGDVDPLPPGRKERPLPVPKFHRAMALDHDFPVSGEANAVLLQGEDGKVDQVLVPCATSSKLVEPIVAAMAKARLVRATRGGVPAKAIVVVPVRY
jgi:hypothetical protein